ncbi:MAG: peptidoglycan DD-metalloendopeptidase family protein [Oscillospiraceae bacterium]
MKDKLNKALTNIDESLIEEAAGATRAEHRVRNMAVKIAIPVGVAAAVAGAVLITKPYNNLQPETSGISLNAGVQDSKPDASDSQADTNNEYQDEMKLLKSEQDSYQQRIDAILAIIAELQAQLDSISEQIANEHTSQDEREKLTEYKNELLEQKEKLQSEIIDVQAEQDNIARKLRHLERSKRISNLFGSEYSENRITGIKADEYTISSIYFGSNFPEVLMYKDDIAVFTDGSDSMLCIYDTADDTPDNERMVAQIDIKKTVELLQSDPDNGILPTLGNEELCDPGFGIAAYKTDDNYKLVLGVSSTDGEEKSLQKFAVDILGSNVVFSVCDEVSGEPLERIIQSDEITPALVDGFDMYALRLVVNKSDKSRVFDPFSNTREYLPENKCGISLAFSQDGLRHPVYLYDTKALKEGGQWYYKGEGFFISEGSVLLYENGITIANIAFIENDDKSLTVTDVTFPNMVCDTNGKPVNPESQFPFEKINADMSFSPAGSSISFEKWEANRQELIAKAHAEFPKLSYVNIEYRISDIDTRLYFSALASEEITPAEDEDIRYWLYQQTGENHPIVNISYSRIADFTELIDMAEKQYPMLDVLGMGYENADSNSIIFSATAERELTEQEYEDIRSWITTMTNDIKPSIAITVRQSANTAKIVCPLAHVEYGNAKPRYVPDEIRDFDYTQSQRIPVEESTPVVTVADGEVMYVGWYFNYGFVTIIKHDGFSTMYYHLDPDGYCNNVGVKLPAGYLVGATGISGLTEENCLGYMYTNDENFYLKALAEIDELVGSDR